MHQPYDGKNNHLDPKVLTRELETFSNHVVAFYLLQ